MTTSFASTTSFTAPIVVTLSYDPLTLGATDPTTITIRRFDGSTWNALSNCSTDTVGHTVTCQTSNFSDFALFTPTSQSSAGGNAQLLLAPTLSGTVSAAGVDGTDATVTFTITDDGGGNTTAVGFLYSSPTVSTSTIFASYGNGTVRLQLSSLACGTTYTGTPFATNNAGTSYASPVSFNTMSCPSIGSIGSLSGSFSGGSISVSQLATILTPSAAATTYLNSLNHTVIPASAKVTVPSTKPSVSTPTTSSYTFTRDLSLGSSGSDVKRLQQYLNTHGFVIAKTGVGSPGHENSSFGSLTKKALIKFQKAHGISATGYFGPITRVVVGKGK